MKANQVLFSFFIVLLSSMDKLSFIEINSGEKLFLSNCMICHPNGKNVILPEKNLKKESLEANGMNSINSIVYQVRNGKNGMPAFGDRLREKEMKEIAQYLLFQSEKNFEN